MIRSRKETVGTERGMATTNGADADAKVPVPVPVVTPKATKNVNNSVNFMPDWMLVRRCDVGKEGATDEPGDSPFKERKMKVEPSSLRKLIPDDACYIRR